MNQIDPRMEPAVAVGADQELVLTIDLSSLRSALYRSRVWIAGVMAIALLLGVIVTLLMTPIFASTATVQIDQAANKIIGTEDTDASAAIQDADRFLKTQVDILRSRALADLVARERGFYDNSKLLDAFGVEPTTEGKTERHLREQRKDMVEGLLRDNLTITLPTDSRIVQIAFESPDPVLSAEIANSYARNFIMNNLQRKMDASSFAREYLAKQLTDIRERLAASEAAANRYSEQAQIVQPGTGVDGGPTQTLTEQSLVQLNNDLNNATARRIEAAKQWDAIATLSPMSIPQVNSNSAVQRLVEELGSARAERDALSSKYTADHPQVRQLQNKVDALQGDLNRLSSQIRQGLKAPYISALAAENELRAKLSAVKSSQMREQRDAVQLGILDRASQTNRAQYESLLARYNNLSAEAGAPSNNLSIVDVADVSDDPVSPNLKLNLAFALLLGLLISALIVAAREFLFGRVRTPDDVTHALQMPLLGVTPNLPDSETPVQSLRDPKNPLSEAYSSIYAVLGVSMPGGLPKAMAFTSATAGEGKSLSALAIAAAAARTRKRVLLIDSDLRKPRQHALLAVGNDSGFSNLLARSATAEQIVRTSEDFGFDFITSGPIPPNPVELLAPDNIRLVLAELGQRYDFILIDGPPILGLADAIEIGSAVERMVLLVRSGANSHGALRKSIQRLRLANVRISGAILSRFDARQAGYGQEYSYEYTYG